MTHSVLQLSCSLNLHYVDNIYKLPNSDVNLDVAPDSLNFSFGVVTLNEPFSQDATSMMLVSA